MSEIEKEDKQREVANYKSICIYTHTDGRRDKDIGWKKNVKIKVVKVLFILKHY